MGDTFFSILGNLLWSMLLLSALFTVLTFVLCLFPKRVIFLVQEDAFVLVEYICHHKIRVMCLSTFVIWSFQGDVFMFTIAIANQMAMCLNLTNLLKTGLPKENALLVATHRAGYTPPLPVPFVRDSTRGDHVR